MSPSLIAKLQLDVAGYQAALAQSERSLASFKQRSIREVDQIGAAHSKMAKAVGGGSMNRGLGNAAMQAQDIAVQLQMGTSAAIVLGQQGSQLLSAFGTGGAIAGGAIAIGAAFFTMGQNARKAFEGAYAEAAKLDAELALISTGTLPEMAGGITKIDEAIKGWTDELTTLNSTFGISANIADIFGGPDVEQRIGRAAEMLNKLGSDRVAMQNNMLALSQRELAIELARESGEEDKAIQLERELKLQREAKRIDALPLPRNVRNQLKEDAVNKEWAQAQQDQNKRDEAAAKKAETHLSKIESAQQRLNEAKQKAADQQLTLDEKIEAVRQRLAKPDAPTLDRESDLQAQTKKVELQIELNGLLEDQKRALKDAADTEKRRYEAAIKAHEEQKRRQADLLKSRTDTMMNMEVLRMRARGETGNKAADKVERNARIQSYEAEFLKQGASPEFAKKQAKERADLEDKIARRESGLPAKIGGVRGEAKMMGSRGGGGLDEFAKMNEKGWITPPKLGFENWRMTMKGGVWGNIYNGGGLSNRATPTIPHTMMGFEQGSLADRAKRAAGAQDARQTTDTSITSLLQKSLDVLTRGLL